VNEIQAPMSIRASAIVLRGDTVLVVRRPSSDSLGDYVLPGGTPGTGEGLPACARREVLEETGLAVQPRRLAFVLETINPAGIQRVLDMVFIAEDFSGALPVQREADRHPEFLPLATLGTVRMRPPIAGHLRGLAGHTRPPSIPWLGNLWRPEQAPPDGDTR
jgi:8-oxo-dGTP diphosphatase